jgi:hypothetical protein
MIRGAVACALTSAFAGACGVPTPHIEITYAQGMDQHCPGNGDCSAIDLPCDAVMSIRIVDPDDPYNPAPNKRFLSQCETVKPDKPVDACSINSINLDPVALPVRDLEVQIAVFPGAALAVDAETGNPLCPDVHYSSGNGYPFPVEHDAIPAFGGKGYYHPGDTTVTVTLGCTDLSAPVSGVACTNPAVGALTATVEDFDTRVPVSVGPHGDADHLFVSVGEPHSFDGGFVLNPADAIALHLDDPEVPEWSAPGSHPFSKYVCVEVLEDSPQAVATLRCIQATDPLPKLTGFRIKKQLVTDALVALGVNSQAFPVEGLTIGLVLDSQDASLGAYTVSATPGNVGGPSGTVSYMKTTQNDSAMQTSANGIFLSRDAPFGTIFSARGQSQLAMTPAVGGLVAGKITVVVISPMPGPSH